MARGTVVCIEPNIYRDDSGYEAVVAIKGLPRRRKRYPLDSDLDVIRAWVAATRVDLKAELRAFGAIPTAAASVPAAARDTLEAGVARLIPQLPRSCWKADRSHAMAWTAVVLEDLDPRPLGQWDRAAITTEIVNRVIVLWQSKPGPRAIRKVRVVAATRPEAAVAARRDASGKIVQKAHTRRAAAIDGYVRTAPATSGVVVADRTIRHRCRLLVKVWRTLDGPDARTPVDHANVPKPPKSHPVAIPIDVLLATLAKLRAVDYPTFLRYWVFATTLQRPVQIGLARKGDVDLEVGRWTVRSAKQEPAHTIPLEADAVAAFRAFAAAKCWGPFDTGKYGRHIHAAGLPATFRPYQARHTGAFALIDAGVSLDKVQGLLGHTSPLTTQRSYAPHQMDPQRTAAKVLDGRFARLVGPVAVGE